MDLPRKASPGESALTGLTSEQCLDYQLEWASRDIAPLLGCMSNIKFKNIAMQQYILQDIETYLWRHFEVRKVVR